MAITDKIKSLDFLSPNYKLLYKQKQSTKTVTGAFLTFIVAILFIVGTTFFSKDIFLRSNPISRSSKYIVEDPKIYFDDYPIGLVLVSRGQFISDKALEDFEIIVYTLKLVIGETVFSAPTILKLDPCETSFFPSMPEFMVHVSPALHYCINPFESYDSDGNLIEGEKPFISGQYPQKNSQYLGIDIRKKPHLTDEAFTQKYGILSIGLILSNRQLDLSNYEDPLKLTSNPMVTDFDNTLLKIQKITVDKNEIVTDEGILFESKSTQTYLAFGSSTVEYSLVNSSRLISRTYISVSAFADTHHREYLKIQTVMAQIAGLIKTVTFIFTFIAKHVAAAQFYREVVADLSDCRGSSVEINLREASSEGLSIETTKFAEKINQSRNISLWQYLFSRLRVFNERFIEKKKVLELFDLHKVYLGLKNRKEAVQQSVNRITFNR